MCRNNYTLHLYRPSYSISAIKIEIVSFCRVIFKSKDPSENIRGFFFIDYLAWCILSVIKTATKDRKCFYAESWFSSRSCHRQLKYFTDIWALICIFSWWKFHRHFTEILWHITAISPRKNTDQGDFVLKTSVPTVGPTNFPKSTLRQCFCQDIEGWFSP